MPSSRPTGRSLFWVSSAALVTWLAVGVAVTASLCDVWPGMAQERPQSNASALLLAAYDIGLAGLGVLVRALSTSKKSRTPFLFGVASLSSRKGGIRGFLSMLNLVQAVHLHVCAQSCWATSRALSALLTTAPWWMDRRGGWTIVLDGPSSFSASVDEDLREPMLQIVISHVLHLHALFHGLNLTLALTHFREHYAAHHIVSLPEYRCYFIALHVTTSLDVLLQPLVHRRVLPARMVPIALGLAVAVCALFALPLLLQYVSEVGAALSFLLAYTREQKAASNFALALVLTEVFEVWQVLASKYSLVFD